MKSISILNRLFCILTLAASFTFVGCSGGDNSAELDGSKVNVSAEIDNLKSGDEAAKQDALVELAKAGPRAEPAVQQLIALLKDKDQTVRQLSAYALMQIGPKAAAAIPELKELLKDSHQPVVTSAVNAIRAIDPKNGADMKVMNVTGQ